MQEIPTESVSVRVHHFLKDCDLNVSCKTQTKVTPPTGQVSSELVVTTLSQTNFNSLAHHFSVEGGISASKGTFVMKDFVSMELMCLSPTGTCIHPDT